MSEDAFTGAVRRSTEQNRKMWAMLHDLAKQVLWPVDGQMTKLDAEDWKHITSAALKKSQRVAAGIEGGFVILGQHTSRFNSAEMSELIELITAFGAQHNVSWTDPEWQSLVKEAEHG